MGPAECGVNTSPFHNINPENYFLKFSDDTNTYLIVGAGMRSTIQEGLDDVANWAVNGNLKLNTAKT